MVVVHGILVVVLVAIDTTEGVEIPRCGMAFRTSVPFTAMAPAVDGEILGVMVERGWIPGRGAVAHCAVRGKTFPGMVGVGGAVVVRHMTGVAIRRCT